MAFRLYIVPAVVTGSGENTDRTVKYFNTMGLRFAAMDYGLNNLFLVAADLLPADDAAITANADVFAFPFNLATTVGGGNVTSAQNALEAALIPAQWVNGSMVWSQIARTVAGMFQFMQRLAQFLSPILGPNPVIDSSSKLNAQFGSLPSNIQQAILGACTSLGYSTANIQSNTQLRAILKDLADQWGAKPFQLNEFQF